MRKGFQLKLYGQVQGVGFRRNAKAKADQLGLAGYVQNMTDGGVLIEIEGDAPAVSEYISWCQSSPERAHVAELTYTEVVLRGYSGFKILT